MFIDEGVTLGDRVKVQNGALTYHGVTLADGVFIGPGAILTNDRRPRALNADGGLARAADWIVSPISVALGASIGAGAIVVAGCDVGSYAKVGAGSVVTHDVPAHTLIAGRTHFFHQYTIAVEDDRDGIVADLAAAGVSTGIYYPIPAHRQPYVVERGIHADLPMTDFAAAWTLSLPMFPGLTNEDQATVIAAVRAAVEHRASGSSAQAMDPARDGVATR